MQLSDIRGCNKHQYFTLCLVAVLFYECDDYKLHPHHKLSNYFLFRIGCRLTVLDAFTHRCVPDLDYNNANLSNYLI